MTSRVWKLLGQSDGRHYEIAYRVDGDPLCVDCEHELANHIANVLAKLRTPGPAVYVTARLFEGRPVTWYIGNAGDTTLEPEFLVAIQGANCFPPHLTRGQ